MECQRIRDAALRHESLASQMARGIHRFDLSGALARSELFLEYQPIVELHSGLIYGAEALVRWNAQGERILMPDAFVSYAESTGLIVPVGQRVLELACNQLRQWQTDFPSFTMAVNVSVVQLMHREFASAVVACLDAFSIDASKLKIEITETSKIEDLSSVRDQLAELERRGISLILDDFGTGYSSLSHLASLPVDGLKIDRSFTKNLLENAASQSIVTHMIALARDLGLSVVVEGVESREQAEWLSRFPDIAAQGRYYSMPVGADVFWSGKRRVSSPVA